MARRALPLLALIVAVIVAGLSALVPAPAHAWESGDVPDKLEGARRRWLGANTEHRTLWTYTATYAGLPNSLDDELTLRVFTKKKVVAGLQTLQPVFVGAERVRERTTSIAEMTQLPDYAYSLFDWALGNETCPPDASLAPDKCHSFMTGHLGMLNSSHFLPQARGFYAHLHGIALQRADECSRLAKSFHDSAEGRYEAVYKPYVLACEKQAMLIEAVAQHYLQDAWSMGHMWERWGSPEGSEYTDRKMLGWAIGAYSGLIHGAKSVTKLTNDPLCAPGPQIQFSQSRAPFEGTGDRFLDDLFLNEHVEQSRGLFGCAVDGAREVYGKTAMAHGALEAPLESRFDPNQRVGMDSCWNQRATNLALSESFGISHYWREEKGEAPGLRDLGIEVYALAATYLADAAPNLAPFATGVAAFFGYPSLSQSEARALRRDFAAMATLAALKAQGSVEEQLATDLAQGGLGVGSEKRFVGIYPNGHYVPASGPPASYADPEPPWKPTGDAKEAALALTFRDAHVADLCKAVGAVELDDYQTAVQTARAEPSSDRETLAAVCEQCASMVEPHLRFGTPDVFRSDQEPVCTLALTMAPAYVYAGSAVVPSAVLGIEERRREAARWCGCGKQLIAGPYDSCVLDEGELSCWGDNRFGQIPAGGQGAATLCPSGVPCVRTPRLIEGAGTVVQAGVGATHMCAVDTAGSVRCWGNNQAGQLGLGDTQARIGIAGEAIQGATLTIRKVAAGAFHTCALSVDGSLWCWGENQWGQLGLGRCSTFESAPSLVTALSGVVDVVAYGRTTCAVLSDGSARCWGETGSGQTGSGEWLVADANACNQHACVLQPRPIPGVGAPAQLTGIRSLSLGGDGGCAMVDDPGAGSGVQQLVCWGTNIGSTGGVAPRFMQDEVGYASLSSAVSVAAGGSHRCVVLASGELRCWGSDASAQLGIDTASSALCGTSFNGTLIPDLRRCQPMAPCIGGAEPLPPFEAVASGVGSSCALSVAGEVYCWGNDYRGQVTPASNATQTCDDADSYAAAEDYAVIDTDLMPAQFPCQRCPSVTTTAPLPMVGP